MPQRTRCGRNIAAPKREILMLYSCGIDCVGDARFLLDGHPSLQAQAVEEGRGGAGYESFHQGDYLAAGSYRTNSHLPLFVAISAQLSPRLPLRVPVPCLRSLTMSGRSGPSSLATTSDGRRALRRSATKLLAVSRRSPSRPTWIWSDACAPPSPVCDAIGTVGWISAAETVPY
jgi:hypothetical protein